MGVVQDRPRSRTASPVAGAKASYLMSLVGKSRADRGRGMRGKGYTEAATRR